MASLKKRYESVVAVAVVAIILGTGSQTASAFPLPALSKKKDPSEPPSPKQVKKADALFEKGHKAMDEGKGVDAEEFYREAIELNPHEPRYHRQLALLLTHANRGQESEREALIALSCDPEDWRTLLVLGRIYHLMGRYREENVTYKKASDLMPAEEKALKERIRKAIGENEIALKKELEKERKRHEADEANFKKGMGM